MRYINITKLDKLLKVDEYSNQIRHETQTWIETTQQECNLIREKAIAEASSLAQTLSDELFSCAKEKITDFELSLTNHIQTIIANCLDKIGFNEMINCDDIIKAEVRKFTNLKIISATANSSTLENIKVSLANLSLNNFNPEEVSYVQDNNLQADCVKLDTSYGLLYLDIAVLRSKIRGLFEI